MRTLFFLWRHLNRRPHGHDHKQRVEARYSQCRDRVEVNALPLKQYLDEHQPEGLCHDGRALQHDSDGIEEELTCKSYKSNKLRRGANLHLVQTGLGP